MLKDITDRLFKLQAPTSARPVHNAQDLEIDNFSEVTKEYWTRLLNNGIISAQEAEELDSPAKILEFYRKHQ